MDTRHKVFSYILENPKMAMMVVTEAMLEILPRIAKPVQRVSEQKKDHDCFKHGSLS